MAGPFDEEDWFGDKKSSDSDINWGEDSSSKNSNSNPFSFDSSDDTFSTDSPSKSNKVKLPKLPPKNALIVGAAVLALVVGGFAWSKIGAGSNTVDPTSTVSKSPSASPTINNDVDMFSQPKNLQTLIDLAHASTVTVFCGNWSGSGFSVDLPEVASATGTSGSELVTNHHVITDCTNGGAIELMAFGEETTFSAQLYSYDVDNDLAILTTSRYLAPLPIAGPETAGEIGYWVMAVGSPGGIGGELLEGSVNIGNLSSINDETVVTEAAVNHGNSGGPLINARGEVIAVNTMAPAEADSQLQTYSYKIGMLCSNLISCTTN